jgi:hypothetical protein
VRRKLAEELPVLFREAPQVPETVAGSYIRNLERRAGMEIASNVIETTREEVAPRGDTQRAVERVLEGSSRDPERLAEFLDGEPISRVVFDEPNCGRREGVAWDRSNAPEFALLQRGPQQIQRATPQFGGPGGRDAISGPPLQAPRELLEGPDELGLQGKDAALRGKPTRIDHVREKTGLVQEVLRGGDLDGAEARSQCRALVAPRSEDEEGAGRHLEPAPHHGLEGQREAESTRLHSRGVRDASVYLETGEHEVVEPELAPAKAKGTRVQLDGIRVPSVEVFTEGIEVAELEAGDFCHEALTIVCVVRISDSTRCGDLASAE